MFWAHGRLPNLDRTDPDSDSFYAVPNFGNAATDVVAWRAESCYDFYNGTGPYYIALAAGAGYGFLDKLQCEIDFTPSRISVSMAVRDKAIVVSPVANDSLVSWDLPTNPEPRGMLKRWTIRDLQAIMELQATLYVSPIGLALQQNILRKLNLVSFNASDPFHDEYLPALEESFEALLDNILEAYAAAALSHSDSYDLDLLHQVDVVGIHVGSRGYIIALFILNVAALVAIMSVVVMNQFFAASQSFDLADLGAMIAAVSNADTHERESGLVNWNGDVAAHELRAASVKFDACLGVNRSISLEVQRVRMPRRTNDVGDE